MPVVKRLRKSGLLVAVFSILVVVLLELGSPSLSRLPFLAELTGSADVGLRELLEAQLEGSDLSADEREEIVQDALRGGEAPPGFAVPSLAMLDGIVLFSLLLMVLALVVPEHIHVKYQGAATLIAALVVLISAFITILAAMISMMVMIALLLAFPFGTLFYLIKWGTFPAAPAAVVLGLASVFRIVCGCALLFAHQRFLNNKGLILLLLTAMLGSAVVSLLHGVVPGVLVSITDAVAAIVTSVLALIWAIVLLFGSITSILKLVTS